MTFAKQALFFLLAAFALSPWGGPATSLLIGILFAIAVGNPYPKQSKQVSKYALQAAVVGLGFGLNLTTLWVVGSRGFLVTLVTITLTLSIGLLIGRLIGVERKPSILIAVGTAICGGSAIAAVGPVIGAKEEEMSVSLGTVFILNAVALMIFPAIGHYFNMSQSAFGMWAALAIHDTSSVVGASSIYGKEALALATTVKLTRALWIIPVAFAFAALERRQARHAKGADTPRPQIPWFIGLFILAAVVRSYVTGMDDLFAALIFGAKSLLSLTLYLIGAGLSRKALASVGVRPLMAGVTLWVIVGVTSLAVIVGTMAAS